LYIQNPYDWMKFSLLTRLEWSPFFHDRWRIAFVNRV